jgi:Niemann-Pick C1 protein
VGMAVAAAYGICSYLGLLFTPLMSVLPFVMLGIGVDGVFVLSTALDQTDPAQPMPDRMAEAMRVGGVSVAVASLTNFGAFVIGSNTSLPALSAFSIYAAMGLLFNLILQVGPT